MGVNWKQAATFAILALLGILNIGRFIPGFGEALRSMPFSKTIGDSVGIAGIIFLNAVTAYQLWTGKASAWNWDSPKTGYQGWIRRSQHPLSYWPRVLLFLVLTLGVDFVIFLLLTGKIPPP